MSQIVDYGSAALEKRAIFCRLLDKRLHDRTAAPCRLTAVLQSGPCR